MPVLYEYGEWVSVSHTESLKRLLESIWTDRVFTEGLAEDRKYQPFLHFDGDKIRARNFSGFIQREGETIEIYPKVFRDQKCQDKSLMLNHVFYWLSYCRRWKFPFTQAGLDATKMNSFPELIIHLMSKQFHSAICNYPLAMYQEVEEALNTPKGSINFARYVNQSLGRGNFHLVDCIYEPFEFDNKVNRLIKYCCRLLLSRTMVPENIRLLQEIIHLLDDVSDVPITIQDVESINLNRFYADYENVVANCKLILQQQLYSGKSYDLSQWCLLLPMEYIFEDFLAGFLETHFSKDWDVHYQKSDMYLSDIPRVFNLQHDIYLSGKSSSRRKIIVDAKYKMRPSDFKYDPKRGVSQNDLYQMVSYAYKRGCEEVILVYPNISEELKEPDIFEILSGFDHKTVINIKAIELPVWSILNFPAVEINLKNAISQMLI